MRVAFIDNSGALISLVWNVLKEGHDVLYYIQNPEAIKDQKHAIGDGLVPKAKSESEIVDWKPDVVVLYNVPKRAVSLESKHIVAFGSSPHASKLEDERLYASTIAKKYDINVPDMYRFHKVDEVYDFLKEDKSRNDWVFKAEGHDVATSTTHVTNSREQLMAVLEYEAANNVKSFVLQEKIDGIEISIEGWFDYRLEKGWLQPINSTLERKKTFVGDLGPMSGCMGSIVWAWPGERPLLFRQTLERMTEFLFKIKYVGPIDGNFIIDYKQRKPWFIEFTPRFGWTAFEAFMLGMKGSVGEFFVDLGRGTAHKYEFNENFMASIPIYIPTAPNVPLFAPLDEDRRLFCGSIYREDDRLCSIGNENVSKLTNIFVACGQGSTVKEATREVYEDVITQITVDNITYRNDIGEKAEQDLQLLRQWGYVSVRD